MGQNDENSTFFNPITYVIEFLENNGWLLLFSLIISMFAFKHLKPHIEAYMETRAAALHHKNPDLEVNRMEALQRARELQQQKLNAASQRALEKQKENEERKRAETMERLKKYSAAGDGKRLGNSEDGYLPLSGGASTSSYKPPKRSACSGGGCGR